MKYKINSRIVILVVAGIVIGKFLLPRLEESFAAKTKAPRSGGYAGGTGGGTAADTSATDGTVAADGTTNGAAAATAGGGSGGGATGFHAGCPKNANPGGNSPGWYTEGSNKEHLHHHCDWKQKCCYCTDVNKCIKSGTPPFRPGDCRPDWGIASYLGGGPYPKTPDFSKCPPGTR